MAPKLLIIGAGFAGLYVAKDAVKQGFDVTIVDPKVRSGKLLTPQSLRRGGAFEEISNQLMDTHFASPACI